MSRSHGSAKVVFEGPFSTVYCLAGSQMCRKDVYDNPEPHNRDYELSILKHLRETEHANVARLLDSFLDEEQDVLQLFFEFYTRNIAEWISSDLATSNQETIRVLYELCSAVAHVHSLGVLHRDINPANIMIDLLPDGAHPVLIDFGISWKQDVNVTEPSDQKTLSIGTGSYRAPELLLGYTTYSVEVDLWALGCTIANLLLPTGRAIFGANDDRPSSDISLLVAIYQTLGTPDSNSWKDADKLPQFEALEFKHFEPRAWPSILPGIEPDLVDVVAGLLKYTFCERSSANASALRLRKLLHQNSISSTASKNSSSGMS